MDGPRFDRLTRALSTRRTAIGALFSGGLLTALGLVRTMENVVAAPACPPGKKRCRGACIPKRFCCTDANCRPKLTGKLCRNGRCACAPGKKLCRGRCIPKRHCCTRANCPAKTRQTCQAGQCACPADRVTLLNGSCGRTGPCPGCFSATGQMAEPFVICTDLHPTMPWPDCATLLPDSCTSSAQCPNGYFCANASPCSGAAFRCSPLCGD